MQTKSLNLKNLLPKLYSQASNIIGIVKKDIIVSSMTDISKPGVSLWVILRLFALNQAFLLKTKERPKENIAGTPKYASIHKIKNKFSNKNATIINANAVIADRNILNLSVFHKFFITLNIKYIRSYKFFIDIILSYLSRISKGLLCASLIFYSVLTHAEDNIQNTLTLEDRAELYLKLKREYKNLVKEHEEAEKIIKGLLSDLKRCNAINEQLHETIKKIANLNDLVLEKYGILNKENDNLRKSCSTKTIYYQEKDLYDDLQKYIAKQPNEYGRPMGAIAAHRIIERGGPEFNKYYKDFLRKINQKVKR